MAQALEPTGAAAAGDHSAGARGQLAALGLGLLCALLVQLPHLLFHRAFVNLDFTVHYNYAREVVASMEAGDPWPHYAFQAQGGLGEPGLLYYSPLYYMACWLVFQLTGNVWQAMQGVEIIAGAVLGYFAWRLANAWGARSWALAAVPVAVLAPMVTMLQSGFNGYPWACATAPLAVLTWAMLRPEAQGRWLNLPAITALAVTVMVHTVTGLMAVIMLGALTLPPLVSYRLQAWRRPEFWAPTLVMIPGLCLSAAYLLPAFGSQDLIDAAVWRQNYTPFNAFSLPTVTAWIYGLRWFAFQWPVSLVALLLAGLALFTLRPLRQEKPGGRWFWSAALALVLTVLILSSELSFPLWLVDTPLRNIQFPHRLITLLVPLGGSLAALALARSEARALRFGVVALALAGIAMALAGVARDALRDATTIDTSETQFAPYAGLEEYRTLPAIHSGMAGKGFSFAQDCAARGAVCGAGQREGRGMDWDVSARAATRLRLPVYCFPAWKMSVNGLAAPADCDPSTGLVETGIPAGKSVIQLRWQMLPLERAGMALSLLTLFGMVITAAWSARRHRLPGHSRA